MRFEDISVTWKDSLSLLAWKELRLLLLASLNNFRRALKLTVKHFWWLWALWLALLTLPLLFKVVITPHPLFDPAILAKATSLTLPYNAPIFSSLFWAISSIVFVSGIIGTIINFTYYLSTRASVEAKNSSYYVNHFSKIFFFVVAQSLATFCVTPLFLIPTLFSSSPVTAWLTGSLTYGLLSLPIIAGYTFLDFENAKILQILKKGLLLFVHFLPLFLVFSLFNFALLYLLYGIALLLISVITSQILIVGIVLSVFLLQTLIFGLFTCSCYATLYIKVKHAHPNLFFA